MKVTPIQMFMFVQSLCLKIKFPTMELTANAVTFRMFYKSNRDLPRNANAVAVLRDVRQVMNEMNMLDEYLKASRRYPDVIAKLK